METPSGLAGGAATGGVLSLVGGGVVEEDSVVVVEVSVASVDFILASMNLEMEE